MKYISRTHLAVLMIIVVVFGTLLLSGEYFSRPIIDRKTTPSFQETTEQEKLLLNSGELQNQMISKSFIIRPGQSKLSYDEALSLYKNNILQFNEDCQLSSGEKSFNLNNEVMIDNRSSKPNTFTVGTASVVVGPYDFGFLILREKGTSVSIGCGVRKNIVNISVQ